MLTVRHWVLHVPLCMHCMHGYGISCSNVHDLLLHVGTAKGAAVVEEDHGDDEEPGIDKAPTFDDDEDEADKNVGPGSLKAVLPWL